MLAVMLAATAATASPAPIPAPSMTVTGTVTDAHTGLPLFRALVQQDGAVASALTDQKGGFKLPVDPRGKKSVIVTAAGYDELSLPLTRGPLTIRMTPPGTGDTAASDLALTYPARWRPSGAPLTTEIAVAYLMRYQWAYAGAGSQFGTANNNWELRGRWRWHGFLFELDGARYQESIPVPSLANTAYAPSTLTGGARAGMVWSTHNSVLNLAGGLAYRYLDVTPNNNGNAYTHSALDNEQVRHAVGAFGIVGWRPLPLWLIELDAEAAPVVAHASTFATNLWLSGGAEASYEMIPGLRLGLAYGVESWQFDGSDTSHMVGVRLHYRPVGWF